MAIDLSGVTSGRYELPQKVFQDNPSSTFFGSLIQNNSSQFATLETAKSLATFLGGEVVDLKDSWAGGNAPDQYAIQMPGGGPLLNAGLVAARCQMCGVEAGLAAVMQEAGALSGHPVSIADAFNQVHAKETTAQKQPNPPAKAAPSVAAAAVEAPPAPAVTPAATPDNGKLVDAAKQFESLLIGQLLKSAREQGNGGWLNSGQDDSGLPQLELAESELAKSISAQGGLGVSDVVLKGIGRER